MNIKPNFNFITNQLQEHERAHMDKFFDDSKSAQAETIVGPSVNIQGDLVSEGNIKIEGRLTGKVKSSQTVYITGGAQVTADISSANAVIGGEVQGNIKVSDHLILQANAKISGDISCSVLRVEDGAMFTGKCTMSNGNNKKSTPTEVVTE